MRALRLLLAATLLTAGACQASQVVDLGDVQGGKADFASILDLPISIPAADSSGPGTREFSVSSSGPFQVLVSQEGDEELSLAVSGGGLDIETTPALSITQRIEAGLASTSYSIVISNHGDEDMVGTLSLLSARPKSELPSLADPVVMENEFCVYGDSIPYVRDVKWDHPKIVEAMRRLGPGWRSTFSYQDWRVSYDLESENAGGDEDKRNAKVRNFIRVLCGEYRDYEDMIEAKLDVIAKQAYAGPEEVTSYDLDEDLFHQLSYPAYERMVAVMGNVYRARREALADANDGFHFGIGDFGFGSNRVEHSVAPWTHCEMKFMFSKYLVDGAPEVSRFATQDSVDVVRVSTYEDELEDFRTNQCTDEDLSLMYNFRGHNNFKALWLESNAFIWNSRRARKVKLSRNTDEYFLRPWAERHDRARMAWGSYLFPSTEDFGDMRFASEDGGGPILYMTDQDEDGNRLADYRLFPGDLGCGDQGVGTMNPSSNCNMVPHDQAFATANSTGAAPGWETSMYDRADMGFMEVFSTFEERMGRINQAFDRHTNWGPTSYYMLDASAENVAADKVRMIGAYSPVVAASYDISASDFFAKRDFVSNSFESGRTKWMFVMRFKAEDYYDEGDLQDGRAMDFERHYFNETSLSNDFFDERALDRFGFVPKDDIHAVLYFAYGDRGETPPALEDIPAP